jgi:hypothetical protein
MNFFIISGILIGQNDYSQLLALENLPRVLEPLSQIL